MSRMPKVLEIIGYGVVERCVYSSVTCYEVRVASIALESFVCNILTRNPDRETRNTSISRCRLLLPRHFGNSALQLSSA